MATSTLLTHIHGVIGVEVHFSLLPPYVEPKPILGTTLPPTPEEGKVDYLEHEHELPELPSLELTQEELLSDNFNSHGHQEEAEGADFEGGFVMTATFTPPPIG